MVSPNSDTDLIRRLMRGLVIGDQEADTLARRIWQEAARGGR